MADNNGGCHAPHCCLKDFTHTHLGGTHRALIDLDNFKNAVAPVEQQRAQVFLFQQSPFRIARARQRLRGN